MRPVLAAPLLALVAFALSPAAAQEVQLSPPEWRALNVFFSNFAEARVPPFRRGEVDDATLARFGVMHHVANYSLWERIEEVPGRTAYGRLRAGRIDAAAERYFGVRIARHLSPPGVYPGTHGEYPEIEYAGGFYIFGRADYPGFPFAQVRKLLDVGGGEFVATVGIYDELDEYEDVSARSFEEFEEMERAGDSAFERPAMRAHIRRVREGGRERYVLLEWLPAP